MLGTRDYARRCGFSQALLGLSGGIDSALVACIAARALGPRQVLGVAMPSRYSSPGSITDAEALARALGIDFTVIPIEPMFAAYLDTLAPALGAFAPARPADVAAAAADLTEQNLQARMRGAMLMALSNRQDRLLLTTGNKSEVATGYCTLYGDMAGGLAVISDVPKTLVYRLARAVNADRPVIPGVDADTSRRRPSCGRTRPIRTACRPTTCWTRSWKRTWSKAWTPRRWWRAASRPPWSPTSSAACATANTSAARCRRA